EVASYLLTADLVPIVVDRHQQEGGEGIGLFFTLLLRVLPAVGLQRKALEVEIVRELAVTVVRCGQRAPVQQVVPELMSECEALASAVAGLSVVEDLPTGLLAPCPEHALEAVDVDALHCRNRVLVVSGDFERQRLHVHGEPVFSQHGAEKHSQIVRGPSGRFSAATAHSSSSSRILSISRSFSLLFGFIFCSLRKEAAP